ncbi:uncharacterized protein [Solanum lycopersicum]|uniref:uncharacterized protein n=1 Tax=Solanum lycopersicum TaxID=4081 RepID=UPI00374921ED
MIGVPENYKNRANRLANQQHKKKIQIQDEQGQQEESQEEQWQTQRRKHPKTQEQATLNAVWRPVNSPAQKISSNQHEQEIAGISILPTQNSFTNLDLQEKQERQQAEQTGIGETLIDSKTSKSTGIDLSLPSPKTPIIGDVDTGFTDEVVGGMDGGCQEIAINLQEGDTKGGNLPHVMHEGLVYDPRTAHRATRNIENMQKQSSQLQQQAQNSDNQKQAANETIKEQVEKLIDQGQEKPSVTKGNENTPKSKNKPSKQKRDAEKRRQSKQHEKDMEQEKEVSGESCNKFVLVDDNHGLNILPLQVQYMTPHTSDPLDKMQQHGNTEQILDEYNVINSKDEMVEDNQPVRDSDNNDETSEDLIRAFSPYKDETIENEI